MRYRFQKYHKDSDIERIQKESEDNFATQTEVSVKREKVLSLSKSVPVNKDLKNGDEVAYDDGTNVYKYYKIGGRLFRQQLTEV